MSNIEAREGQWYRHRANHEMFCVIAVDEAQSVIDIRDGYGDVDELDFDEWDVMDLELCAAPDHWSSLFDGVEDGDFEHGAIDRPQRAASYSH